MSNGRARAGRRNERVRDGRRTQHSKQSTRGRVAVRACAPAPAADGRRGRAARERLARGGAAGSKKGASTGSRLPTARCSRRCSTRPRSASTTVRRSSSPACRPRRCPRTRCRAAQRIRSDRRRSSSPRSSPSCSRQQRATKPKPSAAASAVSTLPAPWAVKVVVLNGSGDIVYTRTVASRDPGALVPRHAGRQGDELQLSPDAACTTHPRARRSACGSRKELDVPDSRCPAGPTRAPARRHRRARQRAGSGELVQAGSAAPRASPSAPRHRLGDRVPHVGCAGSPRSGSGAGTSRSRRDAAPPRRRSASVRM